MKLFLDYINKIKFYIILQMFPVILAEIIFFLYQLPLEPMVYVTVFWLLTGICACLNGFYRYRKKVQQLELIAAAPDINLSQLDSPGTPFTKISCFSIKFPVSPPEEIIFSFFKN